MPGKAAILWPWFAMALLTFVVWAKMFADRIGEMRERRIDPQSLPTSADIQRVLKRTTAADNFRNLFEIPVLFHVLVALLFVTGTYSEADLMLAWVFVLLRAGHSFIHCTYNNVMHRFSAHSLSTLVLFYLCARFAIRLLSFP
jgi:hypothetical protein